MIFDKTVYLLFFVLNWFFLVSAYAGEDVATVYQSVEQAIRHSPQLKALRHNYQAIEYDLREARAGYYPTIDIEAGYGLEQYSDETSRQPGADPSDSDWDPRGDATLRLVQNLYDGGETSKEVSVQKAILESMHFQIQHATQALTLNAISAHLDVYMQRELVALAEKNLKFHQDIYQSLAEGAQAGTVNMADVTQTRARVARARSRLFIIKADLSRAISTYKRVVGAEPGTLFYAGAPEVIPESLEEALKRTEQKNPELQAFKANVKESGARVALARSNYKPKINIELSSNYSDQAEGDQFWTNTNDAMLVFRWDLYEGGSNKAGADAALSRKYHSQSILKDKLLELQDDTTATWATYLSLKDQKEAYRAEVKYSRETFDAYLNQFGVSKRSLLDVLSAENDYFQSASQLLAVTVNETITAYRILKLGGELHMQRDWGIRDYPEDLRRLVRAIVPLFNSPVASSEHRLLDEPALEIDISGETLTVPSTTSEKGSETKLYPLYSIRFGPFVNTREMEQAKKYLTGRGIDIQETKGSGVVTFIRLLEGVYPPEEAHKRLNVLKKITRSAFALKKGDHMAVYAGSFHRKDRAARFAELLEKKTIMVTQVPYKKKMDGKMLVIHHVDDEVIEAIKKYMSKYGLTAKVISSDTHAIR